MAWRRQGKEMWRHAELMRNQRIKERAQYMWAEAERRRSIREDWRRKRQEINERMRAVKNKDKKTKKNNTKRAWNGPGTRPNPKEREFNRPNANVQCKFYLMYKGPGPGTPLNGALTDAAK